MRSMQDKIAVVTGGTQGLGAAVAQLFAERGAAGIVICGRSEEKGTAKAHAIRKETGCNIVFKKTDLADVDNCKDLISICDSTFGRIDVLVNAAGVTDRGSIIDTSTDTFDKIFAVNVRAPFFTMQHAIKLMRRELTQGTIVNIGSIVALAGQSFIAAYSASKGSIATLTRNAAYSLLRNRIRVNALNFGWMATEGEDRIQNEYHGHNTEALQEICTALPYGRRIDPAEAAQAVAFLATEESGLMTGAVINYDQSVWGAYEMPPTPTLPL